MTSLPGSFSSTHACRFENVGPRPMMRRVRPVAWHTYCTSSRSVYSRGPHRSKRLPAESRSSSDCTKACATSPTYTGWKRASGLASHTAGVSATSVANRLRNRSSGPNTTEGRNTVTDRSSAASTASSPAPLERRYSLGASREAPSALMCRKRLTPAARHADTMRCGSSTCARKKSCP